MSNAKFKTKAGLLTMYAYACGYIDNVDRGENHVSLELDGMFQVKGRFNEKNFWENFERNDLKKARVFFNSMKRAINE